MRKVRFARRQPRRDRAVAMLVTVMMIIAAASVAAVIVRRAANEGAAADRATSLSDAEDAAEAALDRVDATLAATPHGFLTRVLTGEAPRICILGEHQGTLFEPGDDWPATCGVDWIYPTPASNWTGSRVELLPPSTDDPALTVVARSRSANGFDVSLTARFERTAGRTFTVAAANDEDAETLDLSQTVYPSSSVTINGSLYSPAINTDDGIEGSLTPPRRVAAETLTSNSALPGVDTLYAAEGDELLNVRGLIPTPVREASIQQVAPFLRGIACSPAAHVNVSSTRSEGVCLRPGATLTTTDGGTELIPRTTDGFALVPTGNTLQIYAAQDAVDVSGTSPLICGLTGSLRSCATSLSGSTFPGDVDYWEHVAEIWWPASGTLGVDGQVTIGMCGHFTPDVPCLPMSDGITPGAAFDLPLSIGADHIVIGAPVTAHSPLTLASSSEVTVAYWARPHGSPFNLDGYVIAAGSSQGLTAFPEDFGFSGPGDEDWVENATFKGAVIVSNNNGKLGLDGFESVTYTPADLFDAPAWAPTLSTTWHRVSTSTSYFNDAAFDWRRLGVEYHVADTADLNSLSTVAISETGGDFRGTPVTFTSDTTGISLEGDFRGVPTIGMSVGTGRLTADVASRTDSAAVVAHLTLATCGSADELIGFVDGPALGCNSDGRITARAGTVEIAAPNDWTFGVAAAAQVADNTLSLHVDGTLIGTAPVTSWSADTMFIGGLNSSEAEVSEAAFITRALSPQETEIASAYLTRKWGHLGHNGSLPGVSVPLGIEYDDLVFAGAAETYLPTVTGGSGTFEFSFTGDLPPQVTFDTTTGGFTGPANWQETVVELDSYWDHTCARTSAGRTWCWGESGHGQIDHNGSGVRNVPDSPTGLTGTNTTRLGVGQKASCIAANSGGINDRLHCFGELHHALDGLWQVANYGITDVSLGTSQGCVMRTNGWVYCFGQHGLGQVVDGGSGWTTSSSSESPIRATSLGQWTVAELSAGAKHFCARMTDGTARCWGQTNTGYAGQLGRGSGGGTAGVPVTVVTQNGAALTNIDEMDGGGNGHCAITDSRTKVHCWGFGQNFASDVGLFGGPDDYLTSLSVSHASTVCLLNNGVPHCWGTASTSGATGVLGDGTANSTGYFNLTDGDAVIPTGTEIGGFTSVQVGVVGCAVDQGGGVTCWGTDSGAGNGNSLGTGSVTSLLPLEQWTIAANPGFPAEIQVTVVDLDSSAIPGSTVETVSAVGLPT